MLTVSVMSAFAAPAAGAQEEPVAAESSGTVRDDPAADRLRLVTFGLVGLGGVLIVTTGVFWRVTRPPLISQGRVDDATPTPAPAASAPGWGASTETIPTAPPLPAKIPASVILARTPGANPAAPATLAAASAAAVASITSAPESDDPSATATATTPAAVPATSPEVEPAVAVASVADVPAVEPAKAVELVDLVAPEGSPAIDAPPPLADIPLGAPKPLVGNDSAWIIEPDNGNGLLAAPATATDFPVVEEPEPVTDDMAAESESGDTAAEPAVAASPVAATLISALAAIPDLEPTVVRFDDPPVQRVTRRPARKPSPRPAAERAPEPVAERRPEPVAARRPEPVAAPAPEPVATPPADEPPRGPSGAPGFDRIAKEATARQRVVDDMALMASALSRLPKQHDHPVDPDLPPVGEFYDQDLDPDHRTDPPGRA